MATVRSEVSILVHYINGEMNEILSLQDFYHPSAMGRVIPITVALFVLGSAVMAVDFEASCRPTDLTAPVMRCAARLHQLIKQRCADPMAQGYKTQWRIDPSRAVGKSLSTL